MAYDRKGLIKNTALKGASERRPEAFWEINNHEKGGWQTGAAAKALELGPKLYLTK